MQNRNRKERYMLAAAAAAKSLQSCPTLCDAMDCSLLGFSVHGILQARTLEWVAISFSNAWKWKVKVKSLSRVWLLATPWTSAYQAPPSMGFSGQQYWSRVPLPGMLQFMGSQRVGQDWATELNWTELIFFFIFFSIMDYHRMLNIMLNIVSCAIQ